MGSTKTLPVVPDELIEWSGVSKQDFIDTFKPCVENMKLQKRFGGSFEPDLRWCIVLHVQIAAKQSPKQSGERMVQDDLYLYLCKYESSAVFGQPDMEFENVTMWNQKDCQQMIDYLKDLRRTKSPNALGVLRAYNPTTGELI